MATYAGLDITGCTPNGLDRRSFTLACGATLAAAGDVPMQVCALQVDPTNSAVVDMDFTLWPGAPGGVLPDPAPGNVWLVHAVTLAHAQDIGALLAVGGLGLWAFAGYGVGTVISNIIVSHRARAGYRRYRRMAA